MRPNDDGLGSYPPPISGSVKYFTAWPQKTWYNIGVLGGKLDTKQTKDSEKTKESEMAKLNIQKVNLETAKFSIYDYGDGFFAVQVNGKVFPNMFPYRNESEAGAIEKVKQYIERAQNYTPPADKGFLF